LSQLLRLRDAVSENGTNSACRNSLAYINCSGESHGYCVHIASSGHTAIKMLSETALAAVLLEYRLEGMDSEAVASDIKQRFPDLPLILLSAAYCDMPERILWLVDEYLMKSELPERLVWVIERAMRSCGAAATSA
jgi:two-component system response regulator GlrR